MTNINEAYELSEDELENVTGGKTTIFDRYVCKVNESHYSSATSTSVCPVCGAGIVLAKGLRE